MRRWALVIVGVAGLVLVGTAVAARPSKRLSDDDRGRELYDRHCVACHGVAVAGDGPAATAMIRPVPDLRAALTTDTVDTYVTAVFAGKGAMPGFEATFDKADARRVLAWAAQLAAGTAPQPPGTAEPEGEEAGAAEN